MAKFNNVEGVWVIYDLDESMTIRYFSADPVDVIIKHSDSGYGHIMFWPMGMPLSEAIDWWSVEKAKYDPKLQNAPVKRSSRIEQYNKAVASGMLQFRWLVSNAPQEQIDAWLALNDWSDVIYRVVSTVQAAEGARMTRENTSFLEPVDPDVMDEVDHNFLLVAPFNKFNTEGEVNGNTTDASPDQSGGGPGER